MHLQNAVSLINHPGVSTNGIAKWADLGCGNGLFSKALASLLKPFSTIYAIDKTPGIKDGSTGNGIHIITRKSDFVLDELELPPLDGILMANSLHYVKDKSEFINHISSKLKPAGKFIIVEYDSDRSNRWVPYPLPFTALMPLFRMAGFQSIELINTVPSVYRDADIYGCMISR
jgi:trans-aconitate methyltransferase